MKTYLGNMILNPLHHHTLVEQSGIEVAVGPDPLAGKEPVQADSIVEVHKDHVAV